MKKQVSYLWARILNIHTLHSSILKGDDMKNITLRIAFLVILAILVACTASKVDPNVMPANGTSADNSPSLIGKVQLSVYDGSNQLYSDSNPNGSLKLKAGSSY